jgi:hypothetical protein
MLDHQQVTVLMPKMLPHDDADFENKSRWRAGGNVRAHLSFSAFVS